MNALNGSLEHVCNRTSYGCSFTKLLHSLDKNLVHYTCMVQKNNSYRDIHLHCLKLVIVARHNVPGWLHLWPYF